MNIYSIPWNTNRACHVTGKGIARGFSIEVVCRGRNGFRRLSREKLSATLAQTRQRIASHRICGVKRIAVSKLPITSTFTLPIASQRLDLLSATNGVAVGLGMGSEWSRQVETSIIVSSVD
ncbi:hypothetical protein CIB48_g11595 [Xylaria polymorpha]|nr:hypothetical protein CIB48_g11595 [Xylaria polymorpha]